MVNVTDGSNIWIKENGRFDDGFIRGIFKTYFLIIFIFIILVGNWCTRLWVRHKLLVGKTVDLTQTTGWIHGPGLAKTAFEIRKLPGGWLGWLMLLVTILDLVGEYGVAVTVKSSLRATQELFTTGGIMNAADIAPSPDPYWEAFRWASDAQKNNYRNANETGLGDKHYGIYRMVTNDTNFMAVPEDTIGWWSCSPNMTEPLIYDQSFVNAEAGQILDYDIWTDLYRRGKLYDGYSDLSIHNTTLWNGTIPTGPSSHTTIFTASNYQVGELFNISAAIDIHDIDKLGSKEMFILHCQLVSRDAGKTAEAITKGIDIYSVLTKWLPLINGAMFPGIYSTVAHGTKELELNLQLYLNAMTMVAGMREKISSENTQGYKLGVVYRATKLPYWVIALCVVVWITASFLLTLGLYLAFLCKAQALLHDRKNKDGTIVSGKEINHNTPVGLLDWMTHAAYESRDAEQIPRRRQLKAWTLSTTWHAGRRLAIVRASEQGMVNPLKTPGTGSLSQYESHAEQTGYFPSTTKGEYIAIQNREVSR